MYTFFKRNEIAPSTFTIQGGTGGSITSNDISSIYDRNLNTRFLTYGMGIDSTLSGTPWLTITRNTATSMPWYAMFINHNIKNFTIVVYNDTTLVTSGYIRNNVEENLCIHIPSTASNKLYIYLDSTIISNQEKYVHELIVSSEILAQFNPPNNDNFKQSINHIGFQKQVGDGGTISNRFSTKYSSNISLTNVGSNTYYDLKDAWEENRNFVFVPFLTITTFNTTTTEASSIWNGDAYNVVWTGDFGGSFSNNNLAQGYNLNIDLKEIPG